jgi:hypothetical protein
MAKPTSKPWPKKHDSSAYRSGLEDKIVAELKALKILFTYEQHVIQYVKPARNAKYTPDFVLPNGIIVETKGRFVTADRQKHLQIKEQHPDLDIRFVFSNSNNRISKQSKTTYAMWCEKNGFLYADRSIPSAWLKEAGNKKSKEAIKNFEKKH